MVMTKCEANQLVSMKVKSYVKSAIELLLTIDMRIMQIVLYMAVTCHLVSESRSRTAKIRMVLAYQLALVLNTLDSNCFCYQYFGELVYPHAHFLVR